MAARSMGSLTIAFGLVAIPVKVYTAHLSSGGSISFNLLHKKCGSRLKQQYTCIKEGVTVERDEMVKGYEFAKDQYVQFTPEEIKALEEVGTHSMDIAEFVPLDAVDPVFYDKTYYLAPDKGANKPYGLLAEALRQTELCAIGRWAARGNSNIVMLRPIGHLLAMQQLRFAAEVKSVNEIEIPELPVKEAELTLAKQLIAQQVSKTFDPTGYTDVVRERVQAAIDKKVEEGEEISISEEPAAATGKVIDLMEALRASLEGASKKKPSAPAAVEELGPRKAARRVEKGEAKPARKTSGKR
jgi:DNA end-binding protein Ku